jgi:hypothetical protein
MGKTDYRKALDSARAEYDQLMQKRIELDKRIVHLKQTIAGLAVLCAQNSPQAGPSSAAVPSFPLSTRLTSAARQLLAESAVPLTPPQLRDALSSRGLTRYADKLAVIHNTLLRLEKQCEAVKVSDGWVITDKGKLAVQIDSLDLPPHATLINRNGNATEESERGNKVHKR